MTQIATFRAACDVHVSTDKDTVLAEALSVIDQHCPVVDFRADERAKGIGTRLVWLTINFWVANSNEAAAKAREVVSALQHRWPTDSATIDGRPFNTQEA